MKRSTARKVVRSTVGVLECIFLVAWCQMSPFGASFWFSVPASRKKTIITQCFKCGVSYISNCFWNWWLMIIIPCPLGNVSLKATTRFLTRRTEIMIRIFIRRLRLMLYGHHSILHTMNVMGVLSFKPSRFLGECLAPRRFWMWPTHPSFVILHHHRQPPWAWWIWALQNPSPRNQVQQNRYCKQSFSF